MNLQTGSLISNELRILGSWPVCTPAEGLEAAHEAAVSQAVGADMVGRRSCGAAIAQRLCGSAGASPYREPGPALDGSWSQCARKCERRLPMNRPRRPKTD